ncbi:hypothetical protein Sinac_6499 [Singulisphaera acidiphila DSM 18658]|uniref:Prepilin-type N-terminal cleavage/methylation domain-containing protein n=1 Tax=Singulisphaera acidiphila (strain ATCC BAA-1392 / DSM 18658 / VKM B-2454 / MOB10) TaxID=886293 RepID=L0DP30_SINAD|nr:hypothetical protein Sinac_6499 [Singulisphaera acidiphila DSM 18658]
MRPAGKKTVGSRFIGTLRAGMSYVEIIVSMAVLGVTLSGLSATVATRLRLVEALEQRAYLLVPQSATLRLDTFNARTGDFSAACRLDDSRFDVTGPARRWATRLGVAVLALPDARPDRRGTSRFPIEIGPRFTLQFNAPLEPYEHVHDVKLDGLIDDGLEISTTAVLSAAEGP